MLAEDASPRPAAEARPERCRAAELDPRFGRRLAAQGPGVRTHPPGLQSAASEAESLA
jgi:hypothetical protein